MSTPTRVVTITGSYGYFIVDHATGRILERHQDCGEYDYIAEFAPDTLTPKQWDFLDICRVGYFTASGKYEPPIYDSLFPDHATLLNFWHFNGGPEKYEGYKV